MTFDYKKEYKEFYLPGKMPSIVEIPPMNYLAVRGKGNPNEENGAYAQALSALYAVAYTLKMSYKGSHKIDGFFEYVVPPLEGFWWQGDNGEVDYAHKEDFSWISVIRLPDFVTVGDLNWAIAEADRKKKADFSEVEFFPYEEGLCVQCMHMGSYDDEPVTIEAINRFADENGYATDINAVRYHHEIYLSDPRKTEPSKLKTVIRHPIKKKY
jgi:hypothetical protein